MKKTILIRIILMSVVLLSHGCGNRREVEAAFGNAEWLETSGRYREAISKYELVIKLSPRGELGKVARLKIGEIYHKRLRDFDKAESVYSMVVNLYPDSVHSREASGKIKKIEKTLAIKAEALNRGAGLFEQGEFQEALNEFLKAQSLDPHDSDIKIKVELSRERYDEKREREASAAIGKGDLYFAQGKYEKAVKEYLVAQELTPEDTAVWEKFDSASTMLAPIKRERDFEKALAAAGELDLSDADSLMSISGSLPVVGGAQNGEGESAKPGHTAHGFAAGEIYRTNFSIDLPKYNHYFQGYKLSWHPGITAAMVQFTPSQLVFPFLKVLIFEHKEFETRYTRGREEGARPCLNGTALVKIAGRTGEGGISAEIVDARLDIPGRGYFYCLREKSKQPPRP